MEQLALAFESAAEPLLRPRYRVGRDGLIEDFGDVRHVYGFWGRLFGCWRVDAATGRSRAVLPGHPVIGARGIAAATAFTHPVLGPRTPMDVESRYRARAAFAAFFAEIPSRIRCIVAPMGGYQWAALDLIRLEPDFARFAEDALSQGRGHSLYASLALADLASKGRAARAAFAAGLMRDRRRDTLARLSGRPASAALLRALDRLPEGPCARRTYETLIALYADPAKARALGHLPAIAPLHLDLLDALPPALARASLVAFLAARPKAASLAAALVALLDRLPGEIRPRAEQGLVRVDSEAGLARWVARWSRRAEAAAPFPAPPFPGGGRLAPLCSAAALRREARVMNNCLDRMAGKVLSGGAYFYRWTGETRADVMLARDARGRWRFDTALGPANRPLDRQTRTRVMADVRAAALATGGRR